MSESVKELQKLYQKQYRIDTQMTALRKELNPILKEIERRVDIVDKESWGEM